MKNIPESVCATIQLTPHFDFNK